MPGYLFSNDLIEWVNTSDHPLIERVLWIDEGYTIAFVFNIYAKTGFPELRKVSEILEAFAEGLASKRMVDPWGKILREDESSTSGFAGGLKRGAAQSG